jgi:hypothetical protein
MRRRTGKHALVGLAVVGALAIAGVVAGWGVGPVRTAEISPADAVALRFPADWNDDTTGAASADAAAPAATFALASAESRPVVTNVLFNPNPTYAPPASAAALPSAAQPERNPPPKADAKADVKADAKPATRSLAPAPERRAAAPRAKKDSGTLFNDAQLASIKGRLHLSADQEQYWPPVESALRDIGWRASQNVVRASYAPAGSRLADIDPDGPEVQRLKSAAFPLIMSMSDDQKREVRMLAQVMGLERVAASF